MAIRIVGNGSGQHRHSKPSISPRSLLRPVAFLLRMKASRPMKSTSTSPNRPGASRGHASSPAEPCQLRGGCRSARAGVLSGK